MEMNIKHSDIQTAFIVILGLMFISPMFPTFVSLAITFMNDLFLGTMFSGIATGGYIVLGLATIVLVTLLVKIFTPKNL